MPHDTFKLYEVLTTAKIYVKAKNDEAALESARAYYKEDVKRLDMALTQLNGLEESVAAQSVAVPVVEATPVVAPVTETVPEPVTPIG